MMQLKVGSQVWAACDREWCCEKHPIVAWPHDHCAGPGMVLGLRRGHCGTVLETHLFGGYIVRWHDWPHNQTSHTWHAREELLDEREHAAYLMAL